MKTQNSPLIIHVWQDEGIVRIGNTTLKLTKAEKELLENKKYVKSLSLAAMLGLAVRFRQLKEKGGQLPPGDYFFIVPCQLSPTDIRACIANSTLPEGTYYVNARNRDKALEQVVLILKEMIRERARNETHSH